MTAFTDTATPIPAERVRPGKAFQIVNVYRPGTGEFVRQVRHYGTEAQARAKGLLGQLHDTDPLFAEVLSVLRGEA